MSVGEGTSPRIWIMKIFTAIAVARMWAPTELMSAAFSGEVFNSSRNAATAMAGHHPRAPGEQSDDHDRNAQAHADRGDGIVGAAAAAQQIVAQPAPGQRRQDAVHHNDLRQRFHWLTASEYPRARERKVGIHTCMPPRANVIMAMPSVAVQKAGLRASPRIVPRSAVSLLRYRNGPRSGSGRNRIAKASRNPGAAAI